jgi:N-formylglutamate amidohydrolase
LENATIWEIQTGHEPLAATAIHNGHAVRPEIASLLALSDQERLREEDPFTGKWTAVATTRVVGLRSRFEVDLNRPPGKAVYQTPADAWGLKVWKSPLPVEVASRSLAQHTAFFAEMHRLFTGMSRRFGKFVVFDLHSYNYRRQGPDLPPADWEQNPDVNVGTYTMNRQQWAPVVDRFITDLQAFDFLGRHLDVRENVKFGGGYFAAWTHTNFPDSACVLAIEFKKFFMDEWTGQADDQQLDTIRRALELTKPGVLEELSKL